jgi:hypothetical protein
MQITVIDVGQPNTHTAKNGRSYQSMEVTYKGENGNVASKKLMSFANPDVFKSAQTWTKNDTVNVNAQKDDNGYWQWISILGEGESAPVQAKTTATPNKSTRVTGSNYETKEERAQRQVMIVRQSSISSAVNVLTAEGKSPSAKEVLGLAKTFENYVMDNKTIETMEDDIPL